MNSKRAFAPVSSTPGALLAIVLDPEKTLHVVDDPGITAHVAKATAGFREKTLKREDLATLPHGAPARAPLVYWGPQLKGFNLWENVKTLTARALRLARDYRYARVGLLLNSK